MNTVDENPRDVAEYIAGFPLEVQTILQKIRQTILQAAPEAEETIKYQMPAYMQQGILVSFAAYKKHIGIYPAPLGDEQFNAALSRYKTEKSTVRLPLDQPIPYDLITQIVQLRLQDNQLKAEAKAKDR